MDTNLKASFRGCGLFPVKPEEVLKHLPESKKKVKQLGLNDVSVAATNALMNMLSEKKANLIQKKKERGKN